MASNPGASSILAAAAKSTVNAGSLLTQFYLAPRGTAILDILSGAGGAVKNLPHWVQGLGYAGEIASVTTQVQQKDYAGAANNVTSFVLSTGAGKLAEREFGTAAGKIAVSQLGAAMSSDSVAPFVGPLATGTFMASYDLGQYVVAPIVAPTIGNMLYNVNPSFWAPSEPVPEICTGR